MTDQELLAVADKMLDLADEKVRSLQNEEHFGQKAKDRSYDYQRSVRRAQSAVDAYKQVRCSRNPEDLVKICLELL